MPTVALSQSSVSFPGYPPGASVDPQMVGIEVTGQGSVAISIIVTGPDAGAFTCTMISLIAIGVDGRSGGESTTQLGTTATLSAPADPPPLRVAHPFLQIGFHPGKKVPALLQATLQMSWAGGSIALPLSGMCSTFSADAARSPVKLVAGDENEVQIALKYVALDPEVLPVQLSQTMAPAQDHAIPAPSSWLKIAAGNFTLPAPAAKAGESALTAKLSLTTLGSIPKPDKGYGFVVFELPTQSGLASGGPVRVEVDVSAIYVKWQSLDSMKNAQGENLRDYLGYSLGDESDIGDAQGGGRAQYFQRGMIVARKDGKAVVVHGAIYVKYRAIGGLGSSLGQPTEDEKDCGQGGRVAAFEKGDLYWSSKFGSHEVHGAIRDRYNALKGPDGVLGLPISSEIDVLKDGKTIGRHNRFEKDGCIYWSQDTGAWEVYGAIRDALEDTYKGVTGPAGFPIAAQGEMKGDVAAGLPETLYGSFQGGAIVWHDSGTNKGANLVSNLQVFVERFSGSGNHDAFESIGFSGVWLYVNVNISTSGGPAPLVTKMSAGNNPVLNEQAVIYSIPKVRGDLIVFMNFDGWDRVNIGSDNHLGICSQALTAQNLWLLEQPQSPSNGSFSMDYNIQTTVKYDATKFRQEMEWGFDNQGTPDMPWALFADTFSDVEQTENVVLHPFNALFYCLVFKGLTSNGNCVGFCLESIYAQVGRSLFNEPIVRFPWEAAEIKELNIKMGYQLGGDFVDWFLGQFIAGNTHDPNGVFDAAKASFSSGDYPIIVLSTDTFWSDGHCVRPYKFYDVGEYKGKETARVMLVANPDAPGVNWTNHGGGTAVPDDSPAAMIVIDPKANTFSFTLSANSNPTLYAGGDWSGGRMLSCPFHLLSYVPRTPFWEVFALLLSATLVICSNDAQTQQLTDGAGKTFYDPSLKTPPTKWTDIVRDSSKRIGNIARLQTYASDGDSTPAVADDASVTAAMARLTALGHLVDASSRPEIHYARGDGGTLKHELVGTKNGKAQWHMKSPTTECVLTLDTQERLIDAVEVRGVGSRTSTVKVSVAADGAERNAVLSMSKHDGEALFTVHALKFAPGKPVTFGLAQDGKGVSLRNDGAASTCNLTVTDATGQTKTHASIALAAATTTILSLKPGDAKISAVTPLHMQVFDHDGGALLSEADLGG
jgi:LGFP repeat